MPVKTNFLKLNKIQENEYYNTDIENQNLDKIDEKLKEHEERALKIESKINRKDQLKINLSPKEKKVSIMNSSFGACSVEIEGSLRDQRVKNGNFAQGATYMSSIGCMMSSNNRSLTLTSNNNSNCYVKQVISEYIESGDNYFIFAEVEALDDSCSQIYVGLSVSDTGNSWVDGYRYINNPDKNVTKYIYKKVSCPPNRLGKLEFFVKYKYGDKATTGKKIKISKMMAIKLVDEDILLTEEALKCKYVDSGYFEGLQPSRNVAIKSKNKNLVPDWKMWTAASGMSIDAIGRDYICYNNKIDYGIGIFTESFKLKSNTRYYIKCISSDPSLDCILREDNIYTVKNQIVGNPHAGFEFITSEHTDYVIVFASHYVGKISIENFILSELDTNYEKAQSSQIVLERALAKLPNGTVDRIVCERGKIVKYTSTNIGYKGQFVQPNKTTIGINTNPSDYNHVYFPYTQFNSFKKQTNGLDKSVVVEGFEEHISGDKIGTFYTEETSDKTNKNLVLVVNKHLCPDLNTAQNIYGNKLNIAYELDKTKKIELTNVFESLNSYDEYTEFEVEHGLIENERVRVESDDINYFINNKLAYIDFKYQALEIKNVYYEKDNGELIDIKKLGDIDYSHPQVYKGVGWFVNKDKLNKYLNISSLYALNVTYKTSESNNQAKVKLTYNSNLSDTISSNSTSINRLGEQIDYLTNKINSVVEFSPLLQNKAKEIASYKHKISIEKNRLYMEGKITTDKVTSGATIMTIGKTYAPKTDVSFIVSTNALEITASIQITSSGDVKLFYKGGSPKEITLNQIAYGIGDSDD
jgi:hypothetical protein